VRGRRIRTIRLTLLLTVSAHGVINGADREDNDDG